MRRLIKPTEVVELTVKLVPKETKIFYINYINEARKYQIRRVE